MIGSFAPIPDVLASQLRRILRGGGIMQTRLDCAHRFIFHWELTLMSDASISILCNRH